MPEPSEPGSVIEFPAAAGAVEVALDELELVYAFIYARVGNRPDAEDLTQQVALKAIPRLREGSSAASIRAYLFATARTVLASFWATKLGMPEDELRDELALGDEPESPSPDASERVNRILAALPPNYRRVLELRFLRGYSLREVAAEIGSTVGGVKVMQLRALRAAARAEVGDDA
jgi:RNA polymerase sigma-70 factor (ECF subfamily)